MDSNRAQEKYLKATQRLSVVDAQIAALQVKRAAIQNEAERWSVIVHEALLAQARKQNDPLLPVVEMLTAGAQVEKLLHAHRAGDSLAQLDAPLRALSNSLRPALSILLEGTRSQAVENA